MDSQKYLILIDDEDKTSGIESFIDEGSRVKVKYQGKSMEYPYNKERITVLENPFHVDVSDKFFYYKESQLFEIKEMLVFGEKAKVIFKAGHAQVFDYRNIVVDSSNRGPTKFQRLLHYWSEISQYTKTDDEKDAFLMKEFAKLNYINPQSILFSYMNQSKIKIEHSPDRNTIFPFRFNLSQKKALENALESNLSVIEGPPGTGKTQTILNIIANLVMLNKTVAVVSGNNAAVQNVKDKLVKDGYEFFVASLGKSENKKKFFQETPKFRDLSWESDIEELELVTTLRELNDRINHLLELNNKKAILQQKLSAYRLEQEHFESYYSNQNLEAIHKLPFYRKSPEGIISFLADHHIAVEKENSEHFFYKLKMLWKHGFRDFKALKEQEVGYIINLQKYYYRLKIEKVEHEIATIQKELDGGSFEPLLKRHEELSIKLFRHKLNQKYSHIKQVKMNEKSYRNKGNFEDFIAHFPVILSTTHSLRNCIPEGFLFDYVIIDESSQVDLLTGALALSCCKNAIVVGDMKQLPQIVDMDIKQKITSDEVEESYDYFKQNVLSSVMRVFESSVPKELLKEHYRCHPQIINFCNKKYYNEELIPFTYGNESQSPLVLIRTEKGNHMRRVTRGADKGNFNQRELDVIVQFLENPQRFVENSEDIGFAAPYRKQVKTAVSLLESHIEADTVHKYQGREKSVMLFSTVLDHSFMGRFGIPFVDDPCIINVAVSRARDRFILVTDHTLFENESKEVSDLIRYMEYSALDENIIQSDVISVFDLLYKDFSEKLIDLQSRLLNASRFKSENIMWTCIQDLLVDSEFKCFRAGTQILLKNLFSDTDLLTDREKSYVKYNASVDFVIYHTLNNKPVLLIEVDGFASHANNPEQLVRDEMKDSIIKKHDVAFIRFPTTGSGEIEKLRLKFKEVKDSIYG
ncbi:AAA domain-containing protein [Paenibacillus qinlingensis]|uniref:AAA domain-containing protein n=1 Tax=Paenibacillus qinlingensis TaxID=1837343 RepID=UPI0015652DDF|nr:AAA domain-containing protein [Paenibacillus qinlingensis]NQX62895.1 AAA family ATPase [Paenibacillus qinlingensis]